MLGEREPMKLRKRDQTEMKETIIRILGGSVIGGNTRSPSSQELSGNGHYLLTWLQKDGTGVKRKVFLKRG